LSIAFDTNVLVCAVDRTEGGRHRVASLLIKRAMDRRNGVLILQTLAEFYAVTTGKLKAKPEDALRFLDRLRTVLAVQAADLRDFDRAMRGERHGLSFWDALLWATADRIGVRYLLTEDFQDGRILGGVTFVNPFEGGNEALLAKILPLS
jgi:predicted nucleic acid-binding protein